MAKHEEDPGMEGAPEWVTTFVDMISLLVTFFILLFTFSSMEDYSRFNFPQNITGMRSPMDNDGKDRSAVEAPDSDLMSAMHPTDGAAHPHTRPPDALEKPPNERSSVGQQRTEKDLEFDLTSARDEIVLHFEPEAAFGPGAVTVSPTLRRSLAQLAQTLQHYPNAIVIEGHTDTEFKPSPRYPTAEALSCARAVEAARVFLASADVPASRVRVAGLGATRPLNQNSTALERTLNRRVEVRILPPESIPRARGN